ncbi:MAG TPA: ATP-binding protein, partial [Clostridia bacterium]|nr:ATP-binding protein [Clostridia bacterium]
AVKHARASEVEIRIESTMDLAVDIHDNGRGFVYDPANPTQYGNGLINMKERLESLGGGLECRSAPGEGTRVRLKIQLS